MIKRTIYKYVIDKIRTKPVVVITGSRQVGKSTLCKILVKNEHFNYVSLDNTRDLASAINDPVAFLKEHKFPLIIDEVQKCPAIFSEIESIVNKRKFDGFANEGMYVLTGSQSYNLMENVTESLAGRAAFVTMSPLSNKEILNKKELPFEINPSINSKNENKDTIDDLYKNIVRGFYPEIFDKNIIDTESFYSDYVMSYIERDVSQIINLKDKLQFQRFMEVVASSTGEELISDNLAKIIGVTSKTIDSWISILVSGNVITLLQPYYENSVTKRVVKRPKLIFNDTGLACYLAGLNNPTVLKKSRFNGRFVETYIINEIIKSFNNNGINAKFYYYRDTNQHEIDLIIKHNGILNLIECKSGVMYSASDIKAFDQLKNSAFQIRGSGIVCNTDKAYSLKPGFYAIPINSL